MGFHNIIFFFIRFGIIDTNVDNFFLSWNKGGGESFVLFCIFGSVILITIPSIEESIGVFSVMEDKNKFSFHLSKMVNDAWIIIYYFVFKNINRRKLRIFLLLLRSSARVWAIVLLG